LRGFRDTRRFMFSRCAWLIPFIHAALGRDEVAGHDRGPDAGLAVIEAAPGAACQAAGALEAVDASLDAGAEVTQLDPLA
jgi:hypothetical protein